MKRYLIPLATSAAILATNTRIALADVIDIPPEPIDDSIQIPLLVIVLVVIAIAAAVILLFRQNNNSDKV